MRRGKSFATKTAYQRAVKRTKQISLPPEPRSSKYSVSLTPGVYRAAVKIGNGSLSLGITVAVVRMAAEEMARAARK